MEDLESVLTLTGIGTLVLDDKLLVRHATPRMVEVLQLTGDFLGAPLPRSGVPGTATTLKDMCREVQLSHELRATEFEDHRGRWSLLQVLPHAHGTSTHVLVLVQDIGRLKEMEVQVRAFEDRLARISEHGDTEVLDRELQILLVEDADEDARLVEIALRDLPIPMRLHRAQTADVALELLLGRRSVDPDLVLMDLRLPGMSGRELLMAMRENPELTDQAVIILSGLNYDFSVQDIHELGVHAFVSKPMDITDLDAVARVVLEFWAGLVLRPVWEDVTSSSGRRPRS